MLTGIVISGVRNFRNCPESEVEELTPVNLLEQSHIRLQKTKTLPNEKKRHRDKFLLDSTLRQMFL